MVQDTSRIGSRPTLWRTALVVGVFVAAGGGLALFLGEASYVPVFVAVGVVAALGERKRWKQQTTARGDASEVQKP